MFQSKRELRNNYAGTGGDIAKRFLELDSGRSRLLKNKELSARLSYPATMGLDPDQDAKQNYQTSGIEAVKSIMTVLPDSLMSPGEPVWKDFVPPGELDKLDNTTPGIREDGRSMTERENAEDVVKTNNLSYVRELERTNFRQALTMGSKHISISGSCAIRARRESKRQYTFSNHSYTDYVCVRDSSGRLIEVIIREAIHLSELPEESQDMIKEKQHNSSKNNNRIMFTRERKAGNKWKMTQEVDGVIVHEEESKYQTIFVMRWQADTDDDYPMGLIEEVLPNVRSVNALTKAIRDGTIVAAKALIFVDESGTTRRKDVARSSNLDVLPGRGSDVTFMQSGKAQDFSVALNALQIIKQELARQTSLITGAIRDAERVTTAEIEAVKDQIQSPAQIVLQAIDEDIIKPLSKLFKSWLVKDTDEVVDLKDNIITRTVSGISKLNEAVILRKKLDALNLLSQISANNQQGDINIKSVSNDIQTNFSIDIDDWINSSEQKEQKRRQDEAAELQKQLAQEEVKAQGEQRRFALQQGA